MGVIFGSLAASLDAYFRSASGDMSWLNDSLRRDEDCGMSETMTGSLIWRRPEIGSFMI